MSLQLLQQSSCKISIFIGLIVIDYSVPICCHLKNKMMFLWVKKLQMLFTKKTKIRNLNTKCLEPKCSQAALFEMAEVQWCLTAHWKANMFLLDETSWILCRFELLEPFFSLQVYRGWGGRWSRWSCCNAGRGCVLVTLWGRTGSNIVDVLMLEPLRFSATL